MKKQKTNGWQCLRALTLLTVGAMTLMAFAHPSVNNLRQSVVEVRTDTLDQEKTFDVVDEMPQFPWGISAMMSWIGGNLTYPQSCIEQRIEGRVIVSFVVDKSGAVRDAAIVKSVAPELDENTVNVWKGVASTDVAARDGSRHRCRIMPVTSGILADWVERGVTATQVLAMVDEAYRDEVGRSFDGDWWRRATSNL